MSLLDAIHDTPLSAGIGRTPLVRLRRFEPRVGVEIYAKLEARNAGGSVKDRAALSIILEGERTAAFCSTRRRATRVSHTPCSAPRAGIACSFACPRT